MRRCVPWKKCISCWFMLKTWNGCQGVFLTECENCCKILHPNIVQFLGKSNSYPSERGKKAKITMAGDGVYAYESNWPDWEVPERRYSFALQFSIFVDLCQGLHFLYSQNIIHRDLYSSNGLLTKHLVAKISDLRMAKLIAPCLLRHTQASGNMEFMPPEVNPVYGAPIDIFSFGCVCVHVISMQWPMPKDKITENDVVLSEVQHFLVKMSKLPALRCLVERCLQKKPTHRPVIGEVIKSLRGIDATWE